MDGQVVSVEYHTRKRAVVQAEEREPSVLAIFRCHEWTEEEGEPQIGGWFHCVQRIEVHLTATLWELSLGRWRAMELLAVLAKAAVDCRRKPGLESCSGSERPGEAG